MEAVLRSLKLEGDIARYVRCFQIAGFRSFDDLLIEEPSLKDLEVIGITHAGDREKIFYEINPEAAFLEAGLGGGGGGALSGGDLSAYDELADDFGDEDFGVSYGGGNSIGAKNDPSSGMTDAEREYERLKAEYEHLTQPGASIAISAGDRSNLTEAEREYRRMQEEYAQLLNSAKSYDSVPPASGGGLSETELEYQRMQEEYAQIKAQLSGEGAPPEPEETAMSDAEREYQRLQEEYAQLRGQLSNPTSTTVKTETISNSSKSNAELEYEAMQAEYAELKKQLDRGEMSRTSRTISAAEAEYARLRAEYDAMQNELQRITIEEEPEDEMDEMAEMAAEYKRLQELSKAKKTNPNLQISVDDIDAPPPSSLPPPPADRITPTQSAHNRSISTATSTGSLTNAQIASKAREMLTNGADRQSVAQWVRHQQALQQRATGSGASPTLQRQVDMSVSAGARDRKESRKGIYTPRGGGVPVSRGESPTSMYTASPTGHHQNPGQPRRGNTRQLPNNRTSISFSSDPTASMHMDSISPSKSQPTLSRVGESSSSDNLESFTMSTLDEIPRLPRTTSAGAQAIFERTGRTLVPIEGSRISGVTLIQNDSAREQIEALKQLAADGQNLTFGNDLMIEVLDPVTVGKGTNLVTLFLVRLTTNMRQFSHLTFHRLEVRRRFSHFDALYHKLEVATNDTLNLPKFPKKDFFGRTNNSIIEQRLQYFKMMMALISKDPSLRCLSCVVDFFDDSKMEDLKLNDDGTAKLKGTSLTGRMKKLVGKKQ